MSRTNVNLLDQIPSRCTLLLGSLAFAASLALFSSGCTALSSSDRSLSMAETELGNLFSKDKRNQIAGQPLDSQVANPRAKSIRFDGNEILLGSADSSEMSLNDFAAQITELVNKKHFYSASRLIDRHRKTGQRYLWQAWCESSSEAKTNPPQQRLVTDALSKNLRPEASWWGLLEIARSNPVAAAGYKSVRENYITQLRDGVADDDELDSKLQSAAQAFGHSIVITDALSLLAARQSLNGSSAWAESLYRQASELCIASGADARAADLLLLACAAPAKYNGGRLTNKQPSSVADPIATWQAAVTTHAGWQFTNSGPIDTHFWISASQARPASADWPAEVVDVMRDSLSELGCSYGQNDSPDYAIWAAVGLMQYQRGEPQPALVNFKKAETLTTGSNQTWLRIAQSRCLAALDQTAAAAAILSGPATSESVAISSAARAALGSAKLQSGAYEQGAQLLNRAITESASVDWPSKLDAQADLALALAILGETDLALTALHTAQRNFERAGNKVNLLKSLNNELRLLEHEGLKAEYDQIEKKISRIQRS